MKAKKKSVGTKARIRPIKERKKRKALTVKVALLIVTILVSSFVIYSMLYSSSEECALPEPTLRFGPDNPNSTLRAVIVDQLSLTAPNETFMQTAATILTKANYTVDYYPGEEVTVEFYRNLATYNYGLIILRVHSTTGGRPLVALFTSETYSESKYIPEQLTDKVCPVAYSHEEVSRGIFYFGITPSFVESSMNGKFVNTIVIMMGCEGLNNTKMAEAFIQKGDKVYISWNGMVSASHTDQATIQLLQNLLIEKQTIKQAVTETMKEVGPDPVHKSLLIYYPPEVGDQIIEDTTGKPTTKP